MSNGDTGAEVRELQKRLSIEPDGWDGDATEAAVRDFQRRSGLAADGVAGTQTLSALQNGGAFSRHLIHTAVMAAAEALPCRAASTSTGEAPNLAERS